MRDNNSYRAIVADPPWPIRWSGGKGGRRARAIPLPYETMSVDAIKEIDVAAWADPEGAHLYLWSTEEMYRTGIALEVMQAWGFDYVGTIIWRKRNFGMGHFPRPGHEPLLVGRRGKLPFGRKDVHSVQEWRQSYAPNNGGKAHSAKPDGSLDLVESASPGPYLEMFSRRARMGWDTWGNESLHGGEANAQ